MSFALFHTLLLILTPGPATAQDSDSMTSRTSVETGETSTSSRFGSLSIGHLVTSNNNTLKQNQFGIGTIYAGYGVTDDLMIATSPFVLYTFGMNNGIVRWTHKLSP